MGIINILDKQTANLIAAGEVVERPASAVKEMLENCADAGASSVIVEIKDGGTSFIRITDDGCGIAREDVPKTILRHATSKIKTGSDLEAIGTLGFRGEALAAISSVSRLRILTKREEDETGTLFDCVFGEAGEPEDAGCPNGTTIIAENIFENTPARRKFLKKNSTEGIAVYAVCEKFAVSKPEIALTLISDGSVKLQTPGDGKLKNAIYSAIGKDFASAMLPLDYEYAGIRAYGYIGKPEICRPNRNMQNFFVNGRYVKSRTMMAAVEEGFRGFCPAGKFPSCVIFVTIDLRLVDVNIHPAKLEIKFSDDRKLFDTVYFAVKNALSRGITDIFDFDMAEGENKGDNKKENTGESKPESTSQGSVRTFGAEEKYGKAGSYEYSGISSKDSVRFDSSDTKRILDALKGDAKDPKKASSAVQSDVVFENPFDVPQSDNTNAEEREKSGIKLTDVYEDMKLHPEISEVEAKAAAQSGGSTADGEQEKQEIQKVSVQTQSEFIEKGQIDTTKYIGEAFDTYIIAEHGGNLYMIDKHAAHERIIYERIKHARDNNDAQYLLEPLPVTLTPKEFEAVSAHVEYFSKIGFDFEEFGSDSYLIRSIPSVLGIGDVKDTFVFLAGSLAEGNTRSAGEIFDRALYTAACKAAIKAGNKNTEIDDKRILYEIFNNDAVLYCPHGRPVIAEFSKERIERMFGRL